MAQELDLPPSSPPASQDSSAPTFASSPSTADNNVHDEHDDDCYPPCVKWHDEVERNAERLQAAERTRPEAIQTGIMEYVFQWITPSPDEFWLKVVAVCIEWPPSDVYRWFRARRALALRYAEKHRQPDPFRVPHALTRLPVDGRTLDLRRMAVADGRPWSDRRFAVAVNTRYNQVVERITDRYVRMGYGAELATP